MGAGSLVVLAGQCVDEPLQGVSDGAEAYAAAEEVLRALARVAPDYSYPMSP